MICNYCELTQSNWATSWGVVADAGFGVEFISRYCYYVEPHPFDVEESDDSYIFIGDLK